MLMLFVTNFKVRFMKAELLVSRRPAALDHEHPLPGNITVHQNANLAVAPLAEAETIVVEAMDDAMTPTAVEDTVVVPDTEVTDMKIAVVMVATIVAIVIAASMAALTAMQVAAPAVPAVPPLARIAMVVVKTAMAEEAARNALVAVATTDAKSAAMTKLHLPEMVGVMPMAAAVVTRTVVTTVILADGHPADLIRIQTGVELR